MNDIRKKFLESIYVSTENYPASFYEKIQNIPLSSIETEYCAVPNYCDGKKEEFHIRDLIGTNHERYVGKTWIEAYLDLDRGNDIIQLYPADKTSGVLVPKVGYILGTGTSSEVKQDLVLRVNSYVTQGNQVVRVRPFLVVEKDGETSVIYDTEIPEVSIDIDELFAH